MDQRIKCTDVTEALMKAMEKADEMGCVLILYEVKDSDPPRMGSFDSGLTLSGSNWLIDCFKAWLFAWARAKGD